MDHERVNEVSPLGAFIRSERTKRSWTRRTLAVLVREATRRAGEPTGTTEKAVIRWELRGHVPLPSTLAALAEVFGCPVEELTALAREDGQGPSRREFVGALTIAGLGMLDPELVATALGTPSRPDRRLVEDLAALTDEYGRHYWSMKAPALWPALYGHLAVTRRVHALSSGSLQRDAAVVASQAAILLGMLAHRLDRRLDSVGFLNVAGELATEAGDGPRRAHVLVALRAAYAPVTGAGERADPAKALRLTDEAVEVAGAGAEPALRAWLHACRAEDHAQLGHGVDHDLSLASAALAQPATSSGFFAHWDTPRLDGFRGTCAVLNGDADQAIAVLEVVAANTSPDLVSPYTAVRTDLAAAHALRGDVDHACAILGDVLSLAERVGMPERAGRVRRVREAHLQSWAGTRAVAQLDEHLTLFPVEAS